MKHLLFVGIAFAAFHISHSDIPDFCRLPEDEGQGTGFTFALYYNPTEDRCDPFIYKGQGGNANRFANEIQCMRNCSVNAENIYPMEASRVCHLKKVLGGCSGTFLRYYYDSIHDKCKKFIWTGCFGNGNRFYDMDSCNATCAGIHDDGEEDEEDEPDTPIAIICGVLIGVILVAVIITAIVLTVQSKNKSKKKAPKTIRDDNAESSLREQGIELS